MKIRYPIAFGLGIPLAIFGLGTAFNPTAWEGLRYAAYGTFLVGMAMISLSVENTK